VCLWIPVAAGLLLQATACGRRTTSDHARAFNSPRDSGIASKAPAAPATPDSSLGETKTSPFPNLQPAEPPKALTAQGNATGHAHRSPDKAERTLKPFRPPEVASVTRKETGASLPAPPAIGTSVNSDESPALAGTLGTTATATYEAVSPRGIRRILHRLTGNRKGAAVTGGKNFTPPHPIREIQFVLPPGASAALTQKKEIDVKAEVDASGRVTRIELLSPRDEELATLAGYAASHWSFAPARLEEQPVPGEVILHFDFNGSPASAKPR